MAVEQTRLFSKGGYSALYTKDQTEKEKDKVLVQSKSAPGKFFLAFSFRRNLRKLFFSENEGDKNLSVLNGIRVLAICYVVFGHAYIMGIMQPASNNSQET